MTMSQNSRTFVTQLYKVSVFIFKVGRHARLVGVSKDVSHPTDCLTKGETTIHTIPQDGPV